MYNNLINLSRFFASVLVRFANSLEQRFVAKSVPGLRGSMTSTFSTPRRNLLCRVLSSFGSLLLLLSTPGDVMFLPRTAHHSMPSSSKMPFLRHRSETCWCSPHQCPKKHDCFSPDHLRDLRGEPLSQCWDQIVHLDLATDADGIVKLNQTLHACLGVMHNCRCGRELLEPKSQLGFRARSSGTEHYVVSSRSFSWWFHMDALVACQWFVHECHAETADYCCELFHLCCPERHSQTQPGEPDKASSFRASFASCLIT